MTAARETGRAPNRAVSILYCGANPREKYGNHIALGAEADAIEQAIHNSGFDLHVEYATSPSKLVRKLQERKPTIVHFGLHGVKEGAAAEGFVRDFPTAKASSGLVLIESDGSPLVLDAGSLSKVLDVCAGCTQCVVLNACHSNEVARMLTSKVDHVVGMNAAISDDGAIGFAEAFYGALANDKSYRESFEIASARLALQARPEDAVPVFAERSGAEGRGARSALMGQSSEVEPVRAPRVVWLALSAVSALIGAILMAALVFGHGVLVSDTRMWLMSLRQMITPLRPSDRLRIVLLDEQSEATLKGVREAGIEVGAFGTSWRALHARAIDRLVDGGAAVIAFDIAFQGEPTTVLEKHGTSLLASAIARAAQHGTHVVFTAVERDANDGTPLFASELRDALSTSRAEYCALAHPCLGQPGDGPGIPLLPLVLGGAPPSFALSLCAYALAQGTLPTYASDSLRVLLAGPEASSIEITGLDPEPSFEFCRMARAGGGAVQRMLAPFPSDLFRNSERVIPFERLAADDSHIDPEQLDVANRIVLVGQRDLLRDVAIDEASPEGRPLWGISAHAAAIDALLQGDEGLIEIISGRMQLLWIALLCLLTGTLRILLAKRRRWVRAASVLSLASIDVGISVYAAAMHGFLTDPGNHLVALLVSYVLAARMVALLKPEAAST